MILYWRIHFEEWGFVDDKHDTLGWMCSTSWNVSVFLLSIHFHDFPLFSVIKWKKSQNDSLPSLILITIEILRFSRQIFIFP